MKSKIELLRELIRNNEIKKAVAFASKFQRLGKNRDVILRANTAYNNPRFLMQLGYDVEICKQLGVNAIISTYCINKS